MFSLRFDMRAPDFGAPIAELYKAAIEMSEWAEQNGCLTLVVSEHHASPDGYLPAPIVLASAIAARTRHIPIQIAALLVPLHDPIELAEQLAVLDVVSGGRVTAVCALGYRPEEYAMFGRNIRTRGKRMEECLGILLQAWTGEAFEYEGRPVQVTPKPLTQGGPTLMMGGNSAAAAKRAGRFGMGLIAEGGEPSLSAIYLEACREAGNPPGLCVVPPSGSVTTAFVAEDVDQAWQDLGPHMLHDAQAYAAWFGDAHDTATKSIADSVEALRAERGPYRIFTPEEAADHIRSTGLLMMQPLCGGAPPRLAWRSLELVANQVLPAVKAG
jgi:alkanesulfonate monooxygenase SsuD/methylene tetrahydromethanopterin reductase-like flavin-dependent oxidoreductase (luciferase family)